MPSYRIYTRSGNNLTFVAGVPDAPNDLVASLAQANGSYVVIPDVDLRTVVVSDTTATPNPPGSAQYDRGANPDKVAFHI